MNDGFTKSALAFLAFMYLVACVAEVFMVKNGTEAVFESIKSVVPHMAMFLLGVSYGRR